MLGVAATAGRGGVTMSDEAFWVADAWAGPLGAAGITSIDALMTLSGESLDKPGLPTWRRRSRVTLSNAEGQIVTLYLKRYNDPPASEQRRRATRGSARHGSAQHGSAWNEWQWLRRLSEGNVAGPSPVAFGERMAGHRELGSALLMTAVVGESLERVAFRGEGRIPRRWTRGVADLARRLHGLGYFHRDLYLSHVFVDPESAEFSLIDVARMIEPKWIKERWAVKDLASLDFSTPAAFASRADRLRFLLRYLDRESVDESTRRWVLKIRRKADAIAAHDRRRLRRLSAGASGGRE
jgi:hypothetical protein